MIDRKADWIGLCIKEALDADYQRQHAEARATARIMAFMGIICCAVMGWSCSTLLLTSIDDAYVTASDTAIEQAQLPNGGSAR